MLVLLLPKKLNNLNKIYYLFQPEEIVLPASAPAPASPVGMVTGAAGPRETAGEFPEPTERAA